MNSGMCPPILTSVPCEREKRNGRPHNAAPGSACQLWKSVQKDCGKYARKTALTWDLLPTGSSGMENGRIVLTTAHRLITAGPGKCVRSRGLLLRTLHTRTTPRETLELSRRKGRLPHAPNSLQPVGAAILLAFLLRKYRERSYPSTGQATETLELAIGNWQLFCFTIFWCRCSTTSASPWK
jgi:hypothetical protein